MNLGVHKILISKITVVLKCVKPIRLAQRICHKGLRLPVNDSKIGGRKTILSVREFFKKNASKAQGDFGSSRV